MEAALLKLNLGAPEPELINTIFRVAHSIKGGSATFGFSEVASFTHTCETLLDELRGNRMQVTRHITDLLLKSVDVMRDMLRSVQNKTPIDAQRVADLQFDLEFAILQKNAPARPRLRRWRLRGRSRSRPRLRAKRSARIAGTSRSVRTRSCSRMATIRCACCASSPRSATSRVKVDDACAAALADLDPEACYLPGRSTVDTDATREVIDQVFDWAEGDCELKIRDEAAPRKRAGRRRRSRDAAPSNVASRQHRSARRRSPRVRRQARR